MREGFPKEWIDVKLGEITTKPQYGWTCSASQNGNVKLLRTTDISKGAIEWNNVPFCAKNPDDIAKYLIEEDDILISRAGSIGISYRIKEKDLQYDTVFASYLIRFKPLIIIASYIEYFFKSHLYWDFIMGSKAGIAVPNVNASKLKDLPVPLPPLDEQQRIAAKLDTIMPKIEAVNARLERIPQIIKRFRQSVLMAAITGKLTEQWREEHPEIASAEALLEQIKKEREKRNKYVRENAIKQGNKPPKKVTKLEISFHKPLFESDWPFLKLGDLFESSDIFDGPFGSNLKTSDYTESGVRVIRLENIEYLRFVDEKRTYISKEKYETLKKHTVGEGDVIFSSFISENVRTAVLPNLGETAIAKADCFCLRPIENLLNRHFLAYILSNQVYHDYLQSAIHGATRPRINTTQLKNTPIPLPPVEEQNEIVRQVDKFFAFADKLEAHYHNAKVKVEKLPQSVLAKAFRGELVPQDPDDEPAEKLLERIKAEKVRLEKKRKKV